MLIGMISGIKNTVQHSAYNIVYVIDFNDNMNHVLLFLFKCDTANVAPI